jgi:hypothetical protein
MSKDQNDKVSTDVTEEQKQAEQNQQESDEQFQAEELEERIAPGKSFGVEI